MSKTRIFTGLTAFLALLLLVIDEFTKNSVIAILAHFTLFIGLGFNFFFVIMRNENGRFMWKEATSNLLAIMFKVQFVTGAIMLVGYFLTLLNSVVELLVIKRIGVLTIQIGFLVFIISLVVICIEKHRIKKQSTD